MTREEKKNALHCLKVMIDEAVCEECDLYGTTGTDHCEKDCVRVAIKALEQEPKTGHWILTDDNFVYCSECEDSYYPRPIDASWYYCPHCGARMVEPQESEDKE